MKHDMRMVAPLATALFPDAISTRLVFRIYAWVTITSGVFVYMWPNTLPSAAAVLQLSRVTPYGDKSALQIMAAVVAAFGCCAAGFAAVDDPVGRRRALYRFAVAHLVFGVMFYIQWFAIWDLLIPPAVGWAPLLVGLVLLYLAATAPATPRVAQMAGLLRPDLDASAEQYGQAISVKSKPEALTELRSRYEHDLLQAARQEERARLARDLHDAVKQQLFVIQTAAATAQARLGRDSDGVRTAIDQVRSSVRQAMSEMEAMIVQLQASPIETAGLIESIRKQCDALGFRTGAAVSFDIGTMPAAAALPPGAGQALFRVAQEALANVGRHARAQHVRVALGLEHGQLRLSVTDDGAGFDLDVHRLESKGMGTRNMGTRAAEVGGTFTLASEPGKGTTVRFAIPCDTTSATAYRFKAIGCAAALALMIATLLLNVSWLWPLNVLAGAVAAITMVRSLVAARRVTVRAGVAA